VNKQKMAIAWAVQVMGSPAFWPCWRSLGVWRKKRRLIVDGARRGIPRTVLEELKKKRQQGGSEHESVPNPPPLNDRSMSSELDPIPLLNSRYARRQSRVNRASHCGVIPCTPHSSGFVRASLGLPILRAGPPVSEAPVPRAGSTKERDFAKLNLHMDIFHQPLGSRFFDRFRRYGGIVAGLLPML
jgi:hypothetical protein